MKKSALVFSIVNFLLAAATITINILANALPLNGKNTGVLSDQYPNLFVPTGLTFSIWGLIFVLFIVFVGFHLYESITHPDAAQKHIPIQSGFALSCVFNMAWIFAWHYEKVVLSVIIMLALLLTLLFTFVQQQKIKAHGQISLLSTIPIDIYTGWITVATIANITALLVHLGWNGWGIAADVWTNLLIAVGTLIGITVLIRYQAIAYTLVIVWACLGIIIKRSSTEPIYNSIIITSWVAIAILIIMILQTIFVLTRKKTAK
jgi:hypothetical protein